MVADAQADARGREDLPRGGNSGTRAWFNAAVLSWVGMSVLLLLTGPEEKLVPTNLIPFGIVSAAFLGLSVYVSQGLQQGKRLGGAAGILSFLVFSMAAGFGYSFTGVQHYRAWLIRALLLLVLLVALRALWAIIVAYRDSSGPATGS